MTPIAFALTWLALGLGCWLLYSLVVNYGRLLLRLEPLERRLALEQDRAEALAGAGLPVGSVAVDFELPDLTGRQRTLFEWSGREVLLIFFDPASRACQRLLRDLADLAPEPATGLPWPLIVSTGDPAANGALFERQAGRLPVLLQRGSEVARLYRAQATPSGYLVDERGRIASRLALGATALLALADAEPGGVTPLPPPRPLNRDGLPAGRPAPDFCLPRLDGGELCLADYRDRCVLLVFTDPYCEPCLALLPELERVHRAAGEPAIVLISRGDAEANRAMVAPYELSAAVVLQHHWDTSRDYGLFAAPVGYLLDEQGLIARPAAIGADAILALLDQGGIAAPERLQ